MKKRTFLLMEVLIALFLVALCIVPLVKQPIYLFKSELEKIEKLEKERLADWAFSEIKELFLKNEIPWEQIPKRFGKTDPLYLPDVQLQLPGGKKKSIPCTFILYGQGAKPGKNGEDLRQIYLSIYLDEDEYKYRLPMQKLPLAK